MFSYVLSVVIAAIFYTFVFNTIYKIKNLETDSLFIIGVVILSLLWIITVPLSIVFIVVYVYIKLLNKVIDSYKSKLLPKQEES